MPRPGSIGILISCVTAALAFGEAHDPIDLSGFRDGIHHWQMNHGRDRDDPRLTPEQFVEIADNLLRYQNPDGGWPKDIDWLAIIPKADVEAIAGDRLHRSSLDNRNTCPQIRYLAEVFNRTEEERYRDAALRGLAYVLAEQRPSGGWRGADVDAITYNDDVMLNCMELLHEVGTGVEPFGCVDEAHRAKAAAAFERALDVTLRCQIVVDGVKTAWCQQHDHETLAPVKARSYELPSITPSESAAIVRFLMSLKNPSADVIAAVDAAVAWCESVKIEGIRIERIEIDPERFKAHTAKFDRIVVEDPDAPPIWVRFYEIDTGRPFFCNRDGVKVYTLAEVALERRTGYGWYGYWPATLPEEHARWKARLGQQTPKK